MTTSRESCMYGLVHSFGIVRRMWLLVLFTMYKAVLRIASVDVNPDVNFP